MKTPQPFFKRKIAIILIVLGIVFIGMQFYKPAIPNTPAVADFNGPPNVKAIFEKSCYDCHSTTTQLKWFDKIQPVYSIVAQDVKEGRGVLNFSQWGKLAPGDQKAKLFEILNQVATRTMPLPDYLQLHHGAEISDDDIAVLQNYVAGLMAEKVQDTAMINARNKQLAQVVKKGKATPVTLTGVPYIDGYANWDIISTTDRLDNNTMRVIYGNAVAIKAVHDNKINPWPDGAVIAKVAWDKIQDKDGNSVTGAFKQVEFMIKDSGKYAGTKGWGWGRFKTLNREPYGKTTDYATECINCHRPVANNDFVFTSPIKQ